MKLTPFIAALLETGDVVVAGKLYAFDADDHAAAVELLRRFHARDAQEMPHAAPEFDAAAAEWAALFFYRTTQLILLRNEDEGKIVDHLVDFPGTITPAVVYSADLVLRQLPGLFNLAKGLSPDDPLVRRMEQIAAQWPFSSPGMGVPAQANLDVLLGHASLCAAYIDRVTVLRDKEHLDHPAVRELVKTALGDHAQTFWPQAATLLTPPLHEHNTTEQP